MARQRTHGIVSLGVVLVGLLVLWPTYGWGGAGSMPVISDEVLQRLASATVPGAAPPLGTRLDQLLTEASAVLADMDLQARRTPMSAPAQAQAVAEVWQRFGTLRTALTALQTEVRAQAVATRARLAALPAPDQAAAWDARMARAEQQFAQLLSALDTVPATLHTPTRRRAFESTRALVDRLRDVTRHRAIEPDLVTQPTFRQEIPPVQAPGTVTASLPLVVESVDPVSDIFASPAGRTVDTPDGTVAAAAPPALPPAAAACSYTANDLGQGATVPSEVQITQEMRDIAAALHYSPGALYQHVASTIRFEPYYGSLKGAAGTLLSQAGNATDHASLLVALLRAANIPARYVRGTLSLTQDPRLLRWLGARDYPAAAHILAQGRVPVAYNPTTQTVEFTHVWVAACVPYSHYRGAVIEATGYRWIPLDASFKALTYQAGIPTTVAFDYPGYLATRTLQSPLGKYAQQVDTALKASHPTATLQDVGYVGTLVPLQMDVLPAALPYEVRASTPWDTGLKAETATLPARHRYTLTITVQDTTGVALASALTLALPDIVLQRLTLAFKGATTSDQAALDAWQRDGHPPSPIPCTVNVVPVITVEGVNKRGGTGRVGLCTIANRLRLDLHLPELTIPRLNTVTYSNIGAANYHALQAYAFQASDRLLAARADALLDTVRHTPNPHTNLDAIDGEFLHLVGLKYMRVITDEARAIGRLDGGSGESGNHLGLVASQMKVQYLFDLPLGVYRSGFLIDMPGLRSRNVDLTTGKLVWKTFLLAGYNTSFHEAAIWQDMVRTDAVSTVRGLQFARETGIEVLTLTAANWATHKPKFTTNANAALNYISSHVAQLETNFINQGYTLIIPRSLLQYKDWLGAVFVASKDALAHPTQPSASAAFAFNRYAGGATVGPKESIVAGPGSTKSVGFRIDPGTPAVVLPRMETWGSSITSTTGANGLNVFSTVAGDPVNLLTGNMSHLERDLWVKGRGALPFVFERSYNSRHPQDGPLGFGWTHSFHHFLAFYGVESGVTKVSWVDGGGGEKFFQRSGTGIPVGGTLSNPPGIFVVLQRLPDGTYTMREKNGLTYTFESNAGLTAGQRAKLLKITDRNGNALTLSYDAGGTLTRVTDGLTRALTFTYTTAKRLSTLRDWTGRTHQYVYDTQGNLTTYKNPLAVANTQPPVTYTYYTAADGANLTHALQRATLPRGNGMTFEYYSNGKVFRHVNDLGETTTFTYNDFLRETVMVNPRGQTQRTCFDQHGNPLRVVEANGGEWLYTYDAAHPMHRLSARDPLGLTTQYSYDAKGNVTRLTHPSGATVVLNSFTALHQPGKVKDARGNYRLYTYDARGNLLQELVLKRGVGATLDPTTYTPVATDLVAWTIHTYDSVGNRRSTTRVRDFTTQVGPTLSLTYADALSGVPGLNLVQVSRRGDKNGDGTLDAPDTVTLTYDTLGRVTQGVTPAWYPTQITYDPVDRVTRATDAVGQVRDSQYDANGNLGRASLTVDVNGTPMLLDQTAMTYDLADRPDTSMDAGGLVTRSQYDPAGNVTQLTNPDKYTVHFTYDAADHIITAFDQADRRVTRTLDLLGKPRTRTDPTGHTTTYTYYDHIRNGRLKSVTTPAATGTRTTTYDYDPHGNVVKVTDPLGRTTVITYDELERPTRVVEPAYTDATLGRLRPVTHYTYTTLGFLSQVEAGHTDSTGTNPAADVVTVQMQYVTDDFGRRITAFDALGHAWRWTYDVHGNVLTQLDALAQRTTYTWAYGHQLRTRTEHTGVVTTYTRNPLGQVTQLQHPTVTYTYTYDTAHRLASVTDSRGAKTLTYSYSPGGLRNAVLTSEGHRTNSLYDPVGRLTGLWAPGGDNVSLRYDESGRLAERWFPNGLTTRYTYNPDHSLTQVINRTATGATVSQHDYTYDRVGNRLRHSERIGVGAAPTTYTYTYDELDRLRTVDNGNAAQQETYTYDWLGNRTSRRVGTAPPTVALYDAANQLTALRQGSPTGPLTAGFVYDANGQLKRKCAGGTVMGSPTTCTGTTVSTLTYDALRRVTRSTKTSLPTQTYSYDPQDRRIQKTVGTTATQYLYDGPDIMAEYGASWTAAAALYTHGPQWDDPLLRTAGSTRQYYHQDGLGSVVAVSDQAGSTVGTARYDAWGTRLATTGAVPLYGYTGREPDETGLLYYRARYYDPTVGRFTQRDPLGLAGGLNAYAYVDNNPVLLSDPLGLIAQPPSNLWHRFTNYFTSWNPLTRLQGGAMLVGGTVGFIGSATVALGTSPTVGGLVVGAAGMTVSADLWLAGRDQLLSGEPQSTLVGRGLQTVGTALRMRPEEVAGVGLALGVLGGSGGAGSISGRPLWTATKTQSPAQNAFRHFQAHGDKFDALNAVAYVRQAQSFLSNPPPGTLSRVRPNGDIVRYHPTTNTFGVIDARGAPRTMCKPDTAVHGYPTNLDYFNAQ